MTSRVHYPHRPDGCSVRDCLREFDQVRPGSKVLDVGCGVGGPMRNISVFGDCEVQGITINQYQASYNPIVSTVVVKQTMCSNRTPTREASSEAMRRPQC